MKIKLRTVIIVVAAVLILWLIIILPDRISYYKSDNYGYDKKCSELKKELKKAYGKDLGEIRTSFDADENKLTVSFYESGCRFAAAFECSQAVEDYVCSHPDFFLHGLGSSVEVQSKTDPYYDYPREMYIYRGTVEGGTLELDEMQYLTDSYGLSSNEKFPVLDIKKLTVTDYGDCEAAEKIAEISPDLREISFTNYRRVPDEAQLAVLEEILPQCIINIAEK